MGVRKIIGKNEFGKRRHGQVATLSEKLVRGEGSQVKIPPQPRQVALDQILIFCAQLPLKKTNQEGCLVPRG